ncbi:hypothetical protein BDF19DRAFT_436149, partial [Syncephalis fuscata]
MAKFNNIQSIGHETVWWMALAIKILVIIDLVFSMHMPSIHPYHYYSVFIKSYID